MVTLNYWNVNNVRGYKFKTAKAYEKRKEMGRLCVWL